ncbi:MAG: UDP-N-acetylmuramoyl-tripeptide--D-alanyl-D-alanine ligase, partial [Candidatus Methylomirabilales bacterium]
MDSLSVQEILEATEGRLLRGEPSRLIRSFSTDTRTLKPGDLFIPLKGKRFDGHDFLPEAFAKGAIGALLDPQHPTPNLRSLAPDTVLLQVEDTLQALGEIAKRWRNKYPVPLVAVTGSNGKTTTKEMIRSILAQDRSVLASQGTFNNLVGLPLTLLALTPFHEAAVLELGMSALGEIRRLSEIARPDIGVITNIGEAHLESLGSLEGVARAKGELLSFLKGEKVAVLNLDDPYCNGLLPQVRGRLLTFGLNEKADLRAGRIRLRKGGGTTFVLYRGEEAVPVELPATGYHNVYNALAAAAVGCAFDLPLPRIAEGLKRTSLASMRFEKRRLASGAVLINDAYNANPTSMRAAVETFFQVKEGRRAILVLGDMLELGEASKEAHLRLGQFVARFNPDLLITVGEESEQIGEGAIASGLPAERVHPVKDRAEARACLQASLSEETWVLLKASRGMR